jgi:hypothetical protein
MSPNSLNLDSTEEKGEEYCNQIRPSETGVKAVELKVTDRIHHDDIENVDQDDWNFTL